MVRIVNKTEKNKQYFDELFDNKNYQKGIEIIQKHEYNPDIMYMDDCEFYIGDMNVFELTLSIEEIQNLEKLGFLFYEEAECFLFDLNVIK